MTTITYAKVGGPPKQWRGLKVFSGTVRLERVVEVNTIEGWVVRFAPREPGDTELRTFRVDGLDNLRIEDPQDAA